MGEAMKRRTVLSSIGLAALGGWLGGPAHGQPSDRTAKAIASLPFERIEVPGQEALAVWGRLKREGRGWPVVVGGDDDLAFVADLWTNGNRRSPSEILAAAAPLQHPQGLRDFKAKEAAAAGAALRRLLGEGGGAFANPRFKMFVTGPDGQRRQLSPDEVRVQVENSLKEREPEIGPWPSQVGSSSGPSVAFDVLTGKPLDRVHILRLPTTEAAAVPAFLCWGGWNECPPAEYHVAALRSWRERYGAELIGLSGDVMDLRVERRPPTREAAIDLAREQFLYCEDIVSQGAGTLAPLAASLMQDPWWFFWWD